MAQLQRLAIAPAQIQEGQIILTGEQLHYLSRVLRLRWGDRFIAMDGQNNWWLATLVGTQAEICEQVPVSTELPVSITLMVALPKGNGFDEVVRQTTELGVACLVPLVSDRTLLAPSPHKLDRWRRIAREAAEQSERQLVPTILEPVPFATAVGAKAPPAPRDRTHQYICVARGDAPHLLVCLREVLDNLAVLCNEPVQQKIAIATGPEGGWTPAEVEQAIAAGFQQVSLGRRILRAVTAPVVALSLAAAALEAGGEESVKWEV